MNHDLFGQPVESVDGRRPRPDGPYTEDFERLWAIHRQGGKRTAFRAFLKAVPAKISLTECEEKLTAYVMWAKERGFGGAHLSTWINGEYWEQHLPPPTANGTEDGRDFDAARRFMEGV